MVKTSIIRLKEELINEMTSLAVEESYRHANALLSQKAGAQKMKLEAELELTAFFEKIRKGCSHLLSVCQTFEDAKKAPLITIIDQIQKRLLQINMLDEGLLSHQFVKEIHCYWGTLPHQRLYLYQIGKNLLQKQEFEKSSEVFLVLTLLFPQIAEFWLGIGIAEQKQEHYEIASLMHARAILLNPGLIHPYVYAAECYLALRDGQNAAEILCLFFKNSKENQINPSLKQKIEDLQSKIASLGGRA